jgi:hypothetical protein
VRRFAPPVLRPSLLVLAFLAFGLGGCDRIARVRECRALVRRINVRVDEIQAASKKGTPTDYRAASAIYTLLAKEVRAANYSTPTAQAQKDEYAATLDSIAPTVAVYATALESGDERRITETRRNLERLRRVEQSVAKRMENQCDGP